MVSAARAVLFVVRMIVASNHQLHQTVTSQRDHGHGWPSSRMSCEWQNAEQSREAHPGPARNRTLLSGWQVPLDQGPTSCAKL
jgi:hypothetical protein